MSRALQGQPVSDARSLKSPAQRYLVVVVHETAGSLGLTVPASVPLRADEVIE